ncbi:MAG TPA: hypothetical protein VLD67_22250 [Vicinamibacterales bacterium]|nr:hypothetical protein [Vicinamibacterales bacterium]
MMDDTKPDKAGAPHDPENSASAHEAEPAGSSAPAAPAVSPAVERFRSCRWRAAPDAGDYCTHRDVLPFAGKEGFKPESWCPECSFFKLRRTPKKRERVDYMY